MPRKQREVLDMGDNQDQKTEDLINSVDPEVGQEEPLDLLGIKEEDIALDQELSSDSH